MFKYWKKSMVAAGILATLLAGSAFAATEAEDAATQQSGQDYNQKIEHRFRALKKAAPSGPIRTVIISPARAITNSTGITAVPASIMSEGIKPATETIWAGPAG